MGKLGFGDQSTQHIKWSVLKIKIRSIYNTSPSQNVTLFLKQIEFKKKWKIIELISIFDYLAITVNYKLYKNEIFMIYD